MENSEIGPNEPSALMRFFSDISSEGWETKTVSQHLRSARSPQHQVLHFKVIALNSQTQRRPIDGAKNSQFITVTSHALHFFKNTSPRNPLLKGHIAAMFPSSPDAMPLFVQDDSSTELPTWMTTKSSPLKCHGRCSDTPNMSFGCKEIRHNSYSLWGQEQPHKNTNRKSKF